VTSCCGPVTPVSPTCRCPTNRSGPITEFEERHGEPLDVRLGQERPDGQDGSRNDGAPYDSLSAEEAAMHVVDDDRP
jgi:hypothetical protein